MSTISQSYDEVAIVDDNVDIKKKYKYWQLRIVYTLIIGYASYYIVRQNLVVATPEMLKEFGCKKADIGWVFTAFSAIYGIGKFLSGVICDRVNIRFFMAIGLLGSAICSALMGFSSSILTFAILYSLLGIFQSAGWPPVSRLMIQWHSPRQLGTRWSIVSSSHQIGSILILVVGSVILKHFGWRQVFIMPAIVAIVVAFLIPERLRNNPQSVGLPSIYEMESECPTCKRSTSKSRDTGNETVMEIFSKYILKNKAIWYMSIAYFFVYVIRMGIFHWAPTFLQEARGISTMGSAWMTSSFEIMGIAGGIAAGWLSDKVFNGKRNLTSFYFMLPLIAVLVIFWLNPSSSVLVSTALLFTIGFLIYGPQSIIGLAGAESGSLKAAATTNGFVSAFGSLGSAASGWCVGKIADVWGWNAVFVFFIICAVISSFFFVLNRNLSGAKQKNKSAN